MIDNWSLRRKKEAMASLSLFLLTVSSFVNVASCVNSGDTLNSVLPAYAVAVKAETTLNSSVCSQELGAFRDAVDIRKLWALRMLDSSGTPKPGFIYGNNLWLGSRNQCNDLSNKKPFLISLDILRNATNYRNPEEEFPPYEVNYFVARFRHNSTFQYQGKLPNENRITLGLCLPASCTSVQLTSILEKMFRERTLIFTDLYIVDFQMEIVTDLHTDGKRLINTRMIIVVLILAVTLLLMVAGTAYDILVYQEYLRVKKANEEHYNNTSNGVKLTMEMPDSGLYTGIKHPSFCGEILKCFSIYTNTKFIFSTKMGADAIGPINGLRTLTMFMLIAIHVLFFTLDLIDNKPILMRLTDRVEIQTFANGHVTVNTFLVISGFLMAYLYFKPNLKNNTENKKVSGKAKIKEFFVGLLKRFIRLTPAYMMAVGIIELLSIWLNDISIFNTFERPQDSCSKYWWRNLLYIHNLFPLEDLCATWTWYLANDMQYYVIGTFMVLLSSLYFYTAATILVFLFGSSIFVSGYISYINGYVPTLDEMFHVAHLVYYAPWVRFGPYVVGIIAGYILARLNNKLELRRRNIVCLWMAASACGIFVLYGLHKRHISVTATAFYTGFSNTSWGICIAWILIACCTNNGGFVNKLLSLKVWVPLGRLTYCAYLLNPIIIRAIFLYGDSSLHVEILPLLLLAAGCTMMTYSASYIFSLMMETPYLLIVRLFTKPRMQYR